MPQLVYQEEEEYANFLSREFLLGLANIDDGTTKRSYLSSKLNCTKMRVSKKFKGKNSGRFGICFVMGS